MMNDDDKDLEGETPVQEVTSESHLPGFLSEQSSLAYAGIIASSIILLIALTGINSGVKNHEHYKYGISVASIAMIFSAIGWVMAFNKTDGTERILLYNNYFLFLWSFIGAGVLTFGGPFESTGNGFFGAWGMVVFATMALGVNASALSGYGNATTGAAAALLACAIIVLTAISWHGIKKGNDNYGELVYGIVLAILTILIMAGMLHGGDSTQVYQLYVMVGMTVLWSVAAGLLTFRGPFLVTGNGYFGSWGACMSALYGANLARRAQSS